MTKSAGLEEDPRDLKEMIADGEVTAKIDPVTGRGPLPSYRRV
jgi:hypothetical protein